MNQQTAQMIEMTLMPQEDLVWRVIEAAAGRISFQDVCKLVELRHEVAKMGCPQLQELVS